MHFTNQELELIFNALYYLSVSDELNEFAKNHNLTDDEADEFIIALKTKVFTKLNNADC